MPLGIPGSLTILSNTNVNTTYSTATIGYSDAIGATAANLIYSLFNGSSWVGPYTNAASTISGFLNAPPGTQFKVTVQGINSSGAGPLSGYLTNAVAPDAIPSSAPTGLTVLSNTKFNPTYSTVTLGFTAPSDATSAQVVYSLNGSGTWVGPYTNPASMTSGFFNAPPGVLFKAAVQGVNSYGNGPMSGNVTGTVAP